MSPAADEPAFTVPPWVAGHAAIALSPWWGVLELVSLPGTDSDGRPVGPHVEVWNGERYVLVVAKTLRPLTAKAAKMLGRKPSDPVWDEDRKRAWEREPIRLHNLFG